MSFLIPLLPVFAKLGFWFLEKFFAGSKQSEESRDIFLRLAKLMRTAGIKNVRSRFESEKQIDEGNAEWDKRENASPAD